MGVRGKGEGEGGEGRGDFNKVTNAPLLSLFVPTDKPFLLLCQSSLYFGFPMESGSPLTLFTRAGAHSFHEARKSIAGRIGDARASGQIDSLQGHQMIDVAAGGRCTAVATAAGVYVLDAGVRVGLYVVQGLS